MNDNWMEHLLNDLGAEEIQQQDRKREIEKRLKAIPPMELKPRIATAVGLIVTAAEHSGMLQQLAQMLYWRHHCSVPVADELGIKLLAQLIKIFDDSELEFCDIGPYSAEQIAPFTGLRLR